MTLQEFLAKHGRDTLGRLVGDYILQSPDFVGDGKLAKEIGGIMRDLDMVFFAALQQPIE